MFEVIFHFFEGAAMQTLSLVYLGIIGLVLGSFYNVVGLRIPLNQSIISPRSSCPSCKRTLSFVELIPIFSFVVQRGKCSQCRTRISFLYPFIEFVTAFLFVASPIIVGWTVELVFCYTLISLLVIVTVSDLVYMLIPDKVLLFFCIPFLLLQIFTNDISWLDAIAGAIIGFTILLLMAVVTGGGIGGGDIKLFALLGFGLGVKLILLTLFFSIVYGAIVGMLLMLARKVKRRQAIPFGPFIALGAITSYYFGKEIVYWYFGVLV